MKTLMVITFALYVTSAAAQATTSTAAADHGYVAHPGTTALSKDLLFQKVLRKRLEYPVNALRNQLFTRLFVGFDVDERGRVVNIGSLLPERSGFGFEEMVEKTLRKMPHLQPRYQGHYVMPVAFVLRSYDQGKAEHEPSATLPHRLLGQRIMLPQVRVMATTYGADPIVLVE